LRKDTDKNANRWLNKNPSLLFACHYASWIFFLYWVIYYPNEFSFLFSILIFNIRFVWSGFSKKKYLLSINLSQSHDTDCKFNKLSRVDSGYFFMNFLIDFFFISSFNIKLLKIKHCNFFYFLFIWLSRYHNLGRKFSKLTRVDFVNFFNWIFFNWASDFLFIYFYWLGVRKKPKNRLNREN